MLTRPSLLPHAACNPYSCGANCTELTLLSCKSGNAFTNVHSAGRTSRCMRTEASKDDDANTGPNLGWDHDN
jgi:hypothetical protein